jgi:hypothetical protein
LQDWGDAGDKVADQWAEFSIGDVCKPSWLLNERDHESTDWNDLAKDLGKEEVVKQLSPKVFPSMDIMEFLALEKKPLEWAVENLFTKGSFNIIYAGPGQGKSMVSMHLIIAAQMGGIPFEGYQVKKQKVLYVDAELTDSQLDERLKGAYALWSECLDQEKEIAKVTLIPWLMVEDQIEMQMDLYNPVAQTYLNPLIEANDFIVLDNFDKVTRRGAGPEDARTDEVKWQCMWDWIRKWKNKGKTFLVVAHTNKSGVLRGTGKIKDDADTAIQISKIRSDVLPEKFHGRLSVLFRIDKARSIPEDQQYPFVISLCNPGTEEQKETPEYMPYMNTSFKKNLYPWERLSDDQVDEAMKNLKNVKDITKLLK